MGDVVVAGFGALTLVGVVLVALGTLRRDRSQLLWGAAVLLTLAGSWVLGLPAVFRPSGP
jgi:hypothetical protein